MEIKFKKLDPRAVAPERAHNTDAGYDLVATQVTTVINECGQYCLVYHTGLALEIPEGYFAMLVPRSSIFKKSLALTNSVGVIDAGYRGEVVAMFRPTTDVIPAVYREGEKFAQLLILPVPDATFTEASELSISDRGEGGFGSTDSDNATNNTESAPTGSVDSPAIEESQVNGLQTEAAAGQENSPEQA